MNAFFGFVLVLAPFLAFAIIIYMIGRWSGRFLAAKYRDALWDVVHDVPDAKSNALAVLKEWEEVDCRKIYGDPDLETKEGE